MSPEQRLAVKKIFVFPLVPGSHDSDRRGATFVFEDAEGLRLAAQDADGGVLDDRADGRGSGDREEPAEGEEVEVARAAGDKTTSRARTTICYQGEPMT